MTLSKTLHTLLETQEASPDQIAACIQEIVSTGSTTDAQLAALLTSLKLLKLDRDPKVVAAVARVMRENALHVNLTPGKVVVDIVGTGGDGHDTFNVSTAAGIVAAGAGCFVAKHGNRASSSQCGSADVLEKLGCELLNVEPKLVDDILRKSNFCFLFAQKFHPAMKSFAKVRRELGVRTIFNLLGPLTNPAAPNRVIVGVHSASLGPLVAESLFLTGVERGWVVCGHNGLDELSPEGSTGVWEFDSAGKINHFEITPASFGLESYSLEEVRGGDKSANATTMNQLLDGALTGPIKEWVVMNAAALIYLSGLASSLEAGVTKARESIDSGSAKKCLETFRDCTVEKYV